MVLFYRICFIACLGIHIFCTPLYAQHSSIDTIKLLKQEQFYDSLEYRANQKKVTGWIYDLLISPARPYSDKTLALDYFKPYEGKVIANINIKALDVFGPSITDTTIKATHWIERAANSIHTKSNLNSLKRHLLFKVGDLVEPGVIYENERLIRNLPYIKDVRIIIQQDTAFTDLVNVTVLTKDRFSFGASGGLNGTSSGEVKVYNQNIFGVGHEVSVKFVGHINKEPYLGVETFYNINNIAGKYLDMSLGYLNTYRSEGLVMQMDKPFYTQTSRWGYGTTVARMFRTDRISTGDPVHLEDPLNLIFNNVWCGRNFNINQQYKNSLELVFSMAFDNWHYFETPLIQEGDRHFFSDHTLYMASITLSQRRFVQDQLIYSYGITEDIPEGFKNEFIYGYDSNEFGDRHYLQFFTSNGNLLLNQKGYLYLSAGIGGYFNRKRFEEGQVQANINFISKLKAVGTKRVRTFTNLSYTVGIRRYDIENLTLGRLDHIRGFNSGIAVGKQRLSLKLEHVVFLPRQYYQFNLAFFGFADLGIIGSNNNLIFKEDYYSGIGLGLRLHNENLVFETFRLRLAFYPFHPADMTLVNFSLQEQSKKQFNSFQPTRPEPMRFE